jgi:hypothetical protein
VRSRFYKIVPKIVHAGLNGHAVGSERVRITRQAVWYSEADGTRLGELQSQVVVHALPCIISFGSLLYSEGELLELPDMG